MKKPKRSRIAQVFERIFNIRKWSDYERMRGFFRYLIDGIKHLFVPPKYDKPAQTFKVMQARFHLSDVELAKQQKGLLRLSILMLIVAIILFIYSIYNVFMAYFSAFIISLVVCLLALILSFRYHYWYFLIKERKLGCSISQWFRQGLMGEKK